LITGEELRGEVMTAPAAAALINLLGYITGSVLYAMLLVMALGRQDVASSIGVGGASSEKTDRLPLLTALLGLAWNLGAITAYRPVARAAKS
jgi:hypothetical protein